MFEIEWSDIERLVSKNDQVRYSVSFERRKNRGTKQKDYHLIIGEYEVAVMEEYFSCFAPEKRRGRFFRKLLSNDHTISGSEIKIGKNKASDIGKYVAEVLKLLVPEKYTGHCWRRTATTILANKGLTLPQIKTMTGHLSDTVVQGYIDKSTVMKELGATALSVGDSSTKQRCSRPRADESEDEHSPPSKKRASININLNFSGAQISAPINLLAHDHIAQMMGSR